MDEKIHSHEKPMLSFTNAGIDLCLWVEWNKRAFNKLCAPNSKILKKGARKWGETWGKFCHV